MAVLDKINEIRKRHGDVPLQEGGIPVYSNKNNITTLGGAMALGAGRSFNDMSLGAFGGVLSAIGAGIEKISPWSGKSYNDADEYFQRYYGATTEDIERMFPKDDSWFTTVGKGTLATHNYIEDTLNDWRQDLLGDNPTAMARISEGTGTSLGYLGAALALGYLTGGGAAAGAVGAASRGPILSSARWALDRGLSEALAEYGGYYGDVYRKGLIDKDGAHSTGLKMLGTNWALNAALEYGGQQLANGLGNVAGRVLPENMRNILKNGPWSRYALSSFGEMANELVQEPSQDIIQEAAWRSLENGTGFFFGEGDNILSKISNSELGSGIKNDWWDRFKQLAPEVSASTALTSLITLPWGIGRMRAQIDQEHKVEEYNKLLEDREATQERLKNLDPSNVSAIEAQRLHLANLEATLANFDKSPEEIEKAKVGAQLVTEYDNTEGEINRIITQNNNVIHPNSEAEQTIFGLMNDRNNIYNVLQGEDVDAAKTLAADLSSRRRTQQFADLNNLVRQAQNAELQRIGAMETPQTQASEPYIAQAPYVPSQQTTLTPFAYEADNETTQQSEQVQNEAPTSTLPDELLNPLYEESTRIMASLRNLRIYQ